MLAFCVFFTVPCIYPLWMMSHLDDFRPRNTYELSDDVSLRGLLFELKETQRFRVFRIKQKFPTNYNDFNHRFRYFSITM